MSFVLLFLFWLKEKTCRPFDIQSPRDKKNPNNCKFVLGKKRIKGFKNYCKRGSKKKIIQIIAILVIVKFSLCIFLFSFKNYFIVENPLLSVVRWIKPKSWIVPSIRCTFDSLHLPHTNFSNCQITFLFLFSFSYHILRIMFVLNI